MNVNAIALKAQQLLQVEIELRLEGSKAYRPGFNPAADVSQEIVRIGKRETDATTVEKRAQTAPIPGQV